MADGKLVFLRPASGSAKLVLGDAHAGSIVPDANLAIDAGFAGDAAANVRLAYGRPLAVDAGFAGEGAADVQLLWDANVSRGGLRHELRSHWQPAHTLAAGLGAAWQQAQPLHLGTQARWQLAITQRGAVRGHWQDAARERTAVATCWQQGELRRAGVDLLWQEAERLRAAALTRWQHGELRRAAVRSHWQEMLRLRAAVTSHWQQGQQRHVHLLTSYGDGLPVRLPLRAHWQEAWRPRSGASQLPKPPEPRPPCYDPTRLGLLVFDTQYTGDGRLVFVCNRTGTGPGPGPGPGETIVVPIQRVYVTVNSLTLMRVDGAVPIPTYSFGMSLDVDSWTWQWQATLHADALPLITPAVNGDPVEVLATINGVPYRLCCEGYTRQRQFANTRISVKGRGRAALLDAPYAPTLNHGNTADRTAQQLMADVLTVNGVGIGWGVEFGLTDWLVPGNVWAHQGSYISAILDIAGAAGGYVQPHDTAATLRILPRYPAAPWAWGTLAPTFELPADVVSVEGTDWQQKPAYNRVYVAGTSAGVLGNVVRTGTAGEVLAPMVTHPLITHADAARQRGIAELSDTGRQARLSLRLPVLAQTGVIKPGALVRYVEAGTPHLGLVRGTQVEWSAPTLRQVLAVETHV